MGTSNKDLTFHSTKNKMFGKRLSLILESDIRFTGLENSNFQKACLRNISKYQPVVTLTIRSINAKIFHHRHNQYYYRFAYYKKLNDYH